MENESKWPHARKLLVEGTVTGAGFAVGGFFAAAAFDLWQEWRGRKPSALASRLASTRAPKGTANRHKQTSGLIKRR